jgi:hypothetical protein
MLLGVELDKLGSTGSNRAIITMLKIALRGYPNYERDNT